MLGGDQFENGIAEVLEPLVVGGAAFWMLVVIGAMRERLPEQRQIVKTDAQRPLEFLEWLVRLSDFGLRW